MTLSTGNAMMHSNPPTPNSIILLFLAILQMTSSGFQAIPYYLLGRGCFISYLYSTSHGLSPYHLMTTWTSTTMTATPSILPNPIQYATILMLPMLTALHVSPYNQNTNDTSLIMMLYAMNNFRSLPCKNLRQEAIVMHQYTDSSSL